jgi:phosphomannomutase/phosphoglucomutase
MQTAKLSLTGFKECDIRGEFGSEITPELAYKVGRAIATCTQARQTVVGGDFRLSTPELMEALTRGLMDSGVHVYALGQLSTPGYYFARRHLGVPVGVMITASHNPPDWNGFKPALGPSPITPEQLEQLKHLVVQGDFVVGQGSVEHVDIKDEYAGWLAKRFAGLSANMPKVVMDCGNGATGWVLPDVLDALHVRADVLFGEPDGRFPNRSSDISRPDDLAALQAEVVRRQAALGIGFDGDGDRVGLVDEAGQRVPSDRLIAWLAQALLRQAPGSAIIYDLKLSRLVPETVERHGGKAIAQKSGHTFIKAAMLEHNGLFGGEYSGHLFYRELGGGDDGLYSALLICTLAAALGMPISRALADLPTYFSTPDIRIRYRGEKESLLGAAAAHAEAEGAKLVLLDGVKAEFPEGWALMRASVTEPAFTLRFEGNTKDDMLAVARRFLDGVGEVSDAIWQEVIRHSDRNP